MHEDLDVITRDDWLERKVQDALTEIEPLDLGLRDDNLLSVTVDEGLE